MRVPATRAILYEFGQLKMGVVLIKWAWPKKFARALRALLLQPHHCNNPRSALDAHYLLAILHMHKRNGYLRMRKYSPRPVFPVDRPTYGQMDGQTKKDKRLQ